MDKLFYINGSRDKTIDVLRAIAFILIILVHINPPNWINQFAHFNVPVMVFVAGLCTSLDNKKGYWGFVWHRLKRILIPMYLFILPCYIIPLLIADHFGVIDTGLTLKGILGCFVFWREGMGYIWIFKVFALMAFVTPLAVYINKNIKSEFLYLVILIAIVLCQHGVLYIVALLNPSSPGFAFFIENYISYIFGYLPFLMLGIRLKGIDRQSRANNFWIVTAVVALLLGAISYVLIYGTTIDLSGLKYPPQHFYIVYGAVASILLYSSLSLLRTLSKCNMVVFIGQNTNWIYLWHFPFVPICLLFISSWIIRFLVVFSIAITIYSIQYRIVTRTKSSFLKKYFIG